MPESSAGDGSSSGFGVSNQLASLVPTFDPAKDDMTMYQQRVELVLAAWPQNRIQELVTRLILNCQGSAFQKLQLHHHELSSGDEKAVKKLEVHGEGSPCRNSMKRPNRPCTTVAKDLMRPTTVS